jgi:hypothetical protein
MVPTSECCAPGRRVDERIGPPPGLLLDVNLQRLRVQLAHDLAEPIPRQVAIGVCL